MNAPRVESSAVSELAIAAVARSLIEAMMVDEGKWIADEIFTLFWLVVHVGHSAAESDHITLSEQVNSIQTVSTKHTVKQSNSQ